MLIVIALLLLVLVLANDEARELLGALLWVGLKFTLWLAGVAILWGGAMYLKH